MVLSVQCGEAPLTNDCFLLVLKTTDSVAELEAVKEKVDLDIARQRSKDSGGEDGMDSDFSLEYDTCLDVRSFSFN